MNGYWLDGLMNTKQVEKTMARSLILKEKDQANHRI